MNAKKRHLIAIDLDGTLLSSQQKISDATQSVLQKAVDAGHIVVIATGRSYHTSKKYYQQLNLNTPIINNNGALVHHPLDKNFRSLHHPLPHQTAISVVETCDEMEVENIIAQTYDSMFIDKHNETIINVFKALGDLDLQFGKLQEILKQDPTSLFIYPKAEQVDILNAHLNEHHAEAISHRTWAAPWNIIEIVKKGLSKAFGLDELSRYFDISREQIIAFGDEDNDLEMIEYAGVGVAMDNGIKELKSIAHHVTDSNDNEGVGKFLQDYLNM